MVLLASVLRSRFKTPGLLAVTLTACVLLAGCVPTAQQPVQGASDARQTQVGTDTAAETAGEAVVADPADSYLAPDAPAPGERLYEYDLIGESLPESLYEDPADITLPGEEITESPLDDLAEVTPQISAEDLEKEREVAKRTAPTFNIPIVMNDKVITWLDYYSKQREKSFKPGLIRSGRYLDIFREIYEEAGLPTDLIYMAHVESAYKTSAYSKAKARGIFQFMTATARMYGLKVDYWVDERLDPEKSARASAAYLKKLYNDFGDWYLVLAAYNAGEGKIRRALRRSGKTDFWGIARTNYIRRETKNHVPAILAATLISKEPEKYGFHFDPDTPIEYDSVKVKGAADLRILAECAGVDVDTMKRLNPALRRAQTPPNSTTDVRVPVGRAETTLAALSRIPRNERVLYARHKVRSGDTLSTIARAYGVSVRSIQATNSMGRSTMIRAGRTLIIPTSSSVTKKYPAPAPVADSSIASGEAIRHRVRRGDTLYGLARRYSTSTSAIAAASGISTRKTLQIGERLVIVPGVRSSNEAKRIAAGSSASKPKVTRTASINPPAGSQTHTVRSGENLWRIARRYNTTVNALCEANQLNPKSTLRPGTRLIVRN